MFAFQPDNTYKHLKHRRLLIVKQLNKSRVKQALKMYVCNAKIKKLLTVPTNKVQ